MCARIEEAVQANRDVRLIVFPEAATVGLPGVPSSLDERWKLEACLAHSERMPGPTSSAIGRLAKAYGVHVATGFLEADTHVTDVVYNSAVLIGTEGEVVAVHRKVQSGGVFKPGSSVQVHDTALGKLGLSICYDQLFPEFVRIQALRGCEVHVNMTANQPLRALSSTVVPIVRAYENTIFVVSANLFADHRSKGGLRYMGGSSIVTPFGEVIARASQEREETIFGEIDLHEILRARAIVSPLKDIRTDVYQVTYHGSG